MVIASEATQAQHGGAALPTHINQIWNMDFAANILFDGRNLFDPQEMEALGFIYKSVGR